MADAWTIEVEPSGALKAHGYFAFVQLPAPNDRVVLGNDLFGVALVEHAPVSAAVSRPDGAREPGATVYVSWIGEHKSGARPWPVP